MTETMRKIKNIVYMFGWTQREFADKVGTTEVSVSRWFNGTRQPNIRWVERMIDVLGMELQIHKR